ncbi:MAG: cell division protein ZapA [Rhodoferax sp.]|nr:cell division protein ZapA [Rhodoferax sp.]
MNQLEVQIMGQSYLLGCPEGGETRLREAVQRVDEAMCKIRDANKVRARDRIAVLAALNLAFGLSDKATPAVPEPATSATAEAAPGLAESAVLQALLTQLDDALNVDGQLL